MTWKKSYRGLLLSIIGLDIVQFLCNPFTGHAFISEPMMAYGKPYYNVKSLLGRNLHLLLIYVIMGTVLVILLVKAIRGARIYSEKYSIMFGLLLFTGLWEMFYLLSRTPVKMSVIAYGVFGILVFYFSLYYRPMRLLDHLLADVASGLTDGLFFFDGEGKCVWADEHGIKLIKGKEGDYVYDQNRLRELFPDLDMEKSEWKRKRRLENRFYNISKHTVYDTRKNPIGSVLCIQNETENARALQKERYIANHDSLTGLYTKKHLFERTREAIYAYPGRRMYVSYLNINNFKFVNDVFGREFGDYVLQVFSQDLLEKLPNSSIVGRLGGDSFGICFPEQDLDMELAEKYMTQFEVRKDSIVYKVIIHQGVYEVTDPTMDVSLMYDRAKIAMDMIKNDYKRHIAIYDHAMRENAIQSQNIALQVPMALVKHEIRPYLQAIVDKDGRVIGAEALARWIHPIWGFMPPARFIPVVEQNGMVADVDRYIWQSAAQLLRKWQEMGREDLFISVNVSPKDFYFMDVQKELTSIVEENHIPPERLRIEITETVMMNDVSDKFHTLQSLQNAGFVVEMDDFGSGFSSLNMLKNMPVDIIKIDMMFLNDMKNATRTSTILRNVINMMSELGLVPLVEGVETDEQFSFLSQMGCLLFQGFLFAKPIPAEEFEDQFLEEAVGQ